MFFVISTHLLLKKMQGLTKSLRAHCVPEYSELVFFVLNYFNYLYHKVTQSFAQSYTMNKKGKNIF